jgi:hypothetical protein
VYSYAELQMQQGNPAWYAFTMRASESGVISKEELELIRASIGEEAYQAEFECSFFANVKGAYYKDQLFDLEAKGQIKDFPMLSVDVALDLGIGDSTALWFAQTLRDEVRIIDYYEDSGKGLDFYVKFIREKPYVVDRMILPHDANARELGSGKTRIEMLRELGVSNIKLLPRHKIEDGIAAVRALLPKCYFHATNTRRGLECLKSYHKEFNEKMQVYINKPLHDWSSHGADGFRYLALGLDSYDMRKRFNSGNVTIGRYAQSGYDIFGL